MAVGLEVPVGVRREPVVPIAVEDHGRRVRDAELPHQLLELLLLDQIALDRILEVVAPVQLDGARNVPLLVQRGILVDLGRHHVLVDQMPREPVGRDEHRLLVSAVVSHVAPPFLSFLK